MFMLFLIEIPYLKICCANQYRLFKKRMRCGDNGPRWRRSQEKKFKQKLPEFIDRKVGGSAAPTEPETDEEKAHGTYQGFPGATTTYQDLPRSYCKG